MIRMRRHRRKQSNETNFINFGAIYWKIWIFKDLGIYEKIIIIKKNSATVPEGTVASTVSTVNTNSTVLAAIRTRVHRLG